MIERVRHFFHRYERYVSPVTLVGGFIFDNITLRRIDLFYSNALLISYLLISAISIVLLNVHVARRRPEEQSETIHAIFVFAMQFCLGGLFSASFLFYSKSGSIIASWPFLLMIVGYIAGNELLRKNYVRLGFQIAVFYTALFSFLIFFIPVIVGKMGDAIFMVSGIASLMIVGVFIYVLSWFAPSRTRRSAPILVLAIGGLFALINGLYFTNLIPPIPLALKGAGIYRSISKLPDGTYATIGERQEWFNFFAPEPTFHIDNGMTLYALSSIFAPAALSTDVIHVWQKLDPTTGVWVTTDRIDLPISGGRESGYRTFSAKSGVTTGEWRVDVETPRGQLIGRLSFSVASSTGAEDMVREVK